jgi:hypothetical protein
MNAGLKYALARVGIFVACAAPALFLLPRDMNLFLKLMIAVVVSGIISFAVLRGIRDDVGEQIVAGRRRRREEREKLRSALAGEDPPTMR